MSELNQHLLAIIQDGFPLVERPYLHLAEMLNVSEQEAFDAVEMLRASGVIRRIGGEPAITHNYIRSHEYNVWFTVIAENEAAIETIVGRICAKTELHDVHVLSATKKYKINTVMTLDERRKTKDERGESREACHCEPTKNVIASEARQSLAGALTESDRTRIRTACDDIPHSLTPFKDWGISCDELREDLASKRMRRFGAILRHQNAGFAFNAMVCFELSPQTCSGAGITDLAKKHYVSHCYERPSFEGFPYNLYAMMHAQTSAELDDYIKDAATLLGNPEYVVLHSVRELKKTSFKFFV